MNSSDQFKQAIENYLSGNANELEKQFIDEWYNSFDDSVVKVNANSPDYFRLAQARIKERVQESLALEEVRRPKILRLWPKVVSAAAILVVIGTSWFFYKQHTGLTTSGISKTANDIAPGNEKAFLTLADGKRIDLTDVKDGELVEQSGIKITKTANGQLIYTVSKVSMENNELKNYNTIETPRGGSYQVRLPDGTNVWLNAASTLKYPLSFSSGQTRRVLLMSGEAYFEVAKDKNHPFVVQTNQQEVKVLGTHFNINTYMDEKSVKTSLLEGSIKVTMSNGLSKTLIPGQQAQTTKTAISVVENIDLENVTAWKNGYFKFSEGLESIMNKVSRWYDVDIIYEIKSSDGAVFNGKISRNRGLRELLNMLEFAGDVHFKIEGRRVIVQR